VLKKMYELLSISHPSFFDMKRSLLCFQQRFHFDSASQSILCEII
jgi:hypothetical protein